MLKSKWYKVRLNTKTKEYTVTTQVFNTQKEGLATIKSNQYEIVNVAKLEKMTADYWVEKQTKKPPKKWEPLNLENDEKVEKDIEAYEKKMSFKEKQKELSQRINKSFEQKEKQKPFNYDKMWNRFLNKKKKEMAKNEIKS